MFSIFEKKKKGFSNQSPCNELYDGQGVAGFHNRMSKKNELMKTPLIITTN